MSIKVKQDARAEKRFFKVTDNNSELDHVA